MVGKIIKTSAVCLVAVILLVIGYNTLGISETPGDPSNSDASAKPGNSSESGDHGKSKPSDPCTPPKPSVTSKSKSNTPTKSGNPSKPDDSCNSGTSDTSGIFNTANNSSTKGTSENKGKVIVLDKNTRTHLQAELTMADYTAFAETVTGKMLSSKVVQGWGDKRPKLIVAALRNNTDNENIRMQDVHDRITETILESGVARLMDISSTDFDYVVRTELSSTRQLGTGKQELAFFKLEFKLFTQDGEMIGQWSDVLPLGKVK